MGIETKRDMTNVTTAASSKGLLFALKNGTGAVLSRLAVISVPFLLSIIGFLINSTFEARDQVIQQEMQNLSNKVEALSARFDGLASIVRASNDRIVTNQGDLREIQTRQMLVEKRLDERGRR